jgi:hypothetical protein
VTVEDKLRAAGITPTIDACAAYRLAAAERYKSANSANAGSLPLTVWQPRKR